MIIEQHDEQRMSVGSIPELSTSFIRELLSNCYENGQIALYVLPPPPSATVPSPVLTVPPVMMFS